MLPRGTQPMGSPKKYQPIWSSRLASYSEHIKERRALFYSYIPVFMNISVLFFFPFKQLAVNIKVLGFSGDIRITFFIGINNSVNLGRK